MPVQINNKKKPIKDKQLKQLIEAAIFVADTPLSVGQLQESVLLEFELSSQQLKKALNELQQDYADRGIQLVEVASGYRFQSMDSLSPWLSRLWQEQAPRYSRAMLETLALIAYRQPITRGEIEEVRGVAVSSQIIKTLSERGWIKVVGHKEVPGRPELFATTKTFLDYFSLSSLSELPSAEAFAESIEADGSQLTEGQLTQGQLSQEQLSEAASIDAKSSSSESGSDTLPGNSEQVH